LFGAPTTVKRSPAELERSCRSGNRLSVQTHHNERETLNLTY
jgi:hypothetical protein